MKRVPTLKYGIDNTAYLVTISQYKHEYLRIASFSDTRVILSLLHIRFNYSPVIGIVMRRPLSLMVLIVRYVTCVNTPPVSAAQNWRSQISRRKHDYTRLKCVIRCLHSLHIDGGPNPCLPAAAAKIGTNFVVDILAVRT